MAIAAARVLTARESARLMFVSRERCRRGRSCMFCPPQHGGESRATKRLIEGSSSLPPYNLFRGIPDERGTLRIVAAILTLRGEGIVQFDP